MYVFFFFFLFLLLSCCDLGADKVDVEGPILFELKREIEDKQELEKWQRIAEGIEARSGNKYPIITLQKKFKELSKVNGGVAAAVKDEE